MCVCGCVCVCVCVCRLDLLHDTGAGDGKTVVVVWSCGIGRGRWLDRYCVVSRTELKRRVNERTRMKCLCKECIDGMDVAAPPPAVDRMASSW